jgi:hypothetical protein
MAGRSTVENQVVRVLDSDGTPLITAMTRAAEDDESVVLAEVDEPEILLNYYFGRGERLVLIELRDGSAAQTVEGTLETWWIAGERRWQVYVDRPLVMLGLVGSAQPVRAAGRV